MAIKKVTWLGVGDLAPLAVTSGRTRTVEERLLTSAIYARFGNRMVVQDTRTGIVEHLGSDVTDGELQRLRPRGFAPSVRRTTPTVEEVVEPVEDVSDAPEPEEYSSDSVLESFGDMESDNRINLRDLSIDRLRELGDINRLDNASSRRRGTLIRDLQALQDSGQLILFSTSD